MRLAINKVDKDWICQKIEMLGTDLINGWNGGPEIELVAKIRTKTVIIPSFACSPESWQGCYLVLQFCVDF